MSKPIVAIVGRPNVGKSTLFNQIGKKRVSIVDDMPGVTRDRIYLDAEWLNQHFTMIDTGGIEFDESNHILKSMRQQAQLAMDEADVILFLVDGRSGLTTADEEVARLLRSTKKPVILAVNKIDSPQRAMDVYEFYNLGLGDPIPISASNAMNLGDLLDAIVAAFPKKEEEVKDEDEISIAVIGRPNVGKSTLINTLIGQKIAIMSDKPQTTQNRILCILTEPDAQIVFLDTPGIHKPKHKLGEYMVKAAEGTLKEVDAILFVVDATEKMGPGEYYILERLQATRKPVILVVNKLDLIEKEEVLPIISRYADKYPFVGVVPISAKAETNLDSLLTEVKKYLPEGPQYYPEDMVTDQPERLIVAELIREKVLQLTRDEVPHAVAVETDEMTTRPNGDVYIRATIYVERDSQKGIIIGAKGAMLKEVGALARKDIEALLGSRVFLNLWVKVKKDWRNREGVLHNFGFGVES